MLKHQLRRELKKTISYLDAKTIEAESLMICEKLIQLPRWTDNRTVLLFVSMPGKEVDTSCIIQKGRDQGKVIAFPRMYGEDIKFHILDNDDPSNMETHPYGVEEPKASLPVFTPSPGNRALIVIPGLGFDASGNRLGRGKGYYDRYLRRYSKYLDMAAVAFSCQIIEKVPVDERDVRIPAVVTPQKTYFDNSSAANS